MEEGEPIEHGMVSRAIERAQKQVEGHNFEIRKHLLEYDDVMNKQREAIYQLRRDILDGTRGPRLRPAASPPTSSTSLVDTHCPEKRDPDDWNLPELATDVLAYFDIDVHAAGVELDELGDRRARATTLWSADRGEVPRTRSAGSAPS